MVDKTADDSNGTNGNHKQTGIDPLFQSIVKKQANFLIWRVEVCQKNVIFNLLFFFNLK